MTSSQGEFEKKCGANDASTLLTCSMPFGHSGAVHKCGDLTFIAGAEVIGKHRFTPNPQCPQYCLSCGASDTAFHGDSGWA